MARPSKQLEDITVDGWELLDSLIIWSAHQEYIAERLGISSDTLGRRLKERFGLNFAQYRDKKKEQVRTNIMKKQYDVAMSGNVSMLIWLGKNWCGQSDKMESTANTKITIDSDDKEV